jgi:hypothetical protein
MSTEPRTETVNPWNVVAVERIDSATIARVMRQIAVSDGIDQLAYREAEIDSLWGLVHMAVRAGIPGAAEVLDLLWVAHDNVADGRREEALAALASVRDHPDLESLNRDVWNVPGSPHWGGPDVVLGDVRAHP